LNQLKFSYLIDTNWPGHPVEPDMCRSETKTIFISNKNIV